MVCTLLIRATDNASGTMKKGWPSQVRDEIWRWGKFEQSDDWALLTVSDSDASIVQRYVSLWELRYDLDIQFEDSSRWRIKAMPNAEDVSLSGTGEDEMTLDMVEWVHTPFDENGAGGTTQLFASTQMQFDLPKTSPSLSSAIPTPDDLKLAEIRRRFSDRFDKFLSTSRYRFDVGQVDTWVAMERPVVTLKELDDAIIDRRLE